MPPAPTFPRLSTLSARDRIFPRWADRNRPEPCGLLIGSSRVPRFPHCCFGGSPFRFRPRPCGPGRFRRASGKLSPDFHPFRCFVRNISVPLEAPVQSPIGTAVRSVSGSRFLGPKALVPLDGFRKVGSALAWSRCLALLPLAALPRFLGFILANIALSVVALWLELSSVSGRPFPATN